MDFILTKGSQSIGIEVKSGAKWRPDYAKGLNVLLSAKKIQQAFLVYRGKHEELHEKIKMVPIELFLSQLNAGKII